MPDHLTFDHDRGVRIGLDEAVLPETEPTEILIRMLAEAQAASRRLLITRLTQAQHDALPDGVRAALDFCPLSRTAWLGPPAGERQGCDVFVASAGTTDAGVATEAMRVLRWSGIKADLVADVGVAGLWRLLERAERLREADVVIVCAGIDAALLSVVAGLVPGAVIAVPTSVGYGVAVGGRAALDAALASCAPGVTVVNIDNGYGAACAALRIANRMRAGKRAPWCRFRNRTIRFSALPSASGKRWPTRSMAGSSS